MAIIIFIILICLFSCPVNVRAGNDIPVPSSGVYFGAWVTGPNGETGNSVIRDFENTIQKNASILSGVWTDTVNYEDPNYPDWNLHQLQNMDAVFHAVPLITLNTTNRTLSEIVSNTIHPDDKRANNQTKPDDFFRGWARGLKAYGKPVFLRFDHEMNGNWSLWSICDLDNQCRDPDTGLQQTPQLYIDAWRHVHEIFREEGVTNVSWVWCPNNIHDVDIWLTPFDKLYPGDAYVDWTALDVYNADTWPWRSFKDLISNNYATFLGIAPSKPIMLAEFNSGFGGDPTGVKKADWIREALTHDLPNTFPQIKAVMWFNVGPTDPAFGSFRIEDTQATTVAFRESVASSYYISAIPIATPIPNPKPGDSNGDGSVNGLDYVIWLNNYGSVTDIGPAKGDFNGDAYVNGLDYVIWLQNYGL